MQGVMEGHGQSHGTGAVHRRQPRGEGLSLQSHGCSPSAPIYMFSRRRLADKSNNTRANRQVAPPPAAGLLLTAHRSSEV